MAIEVAMNTPLADALNMAIQPKLVEVGWATGGPDDSALSEYIILMLVNGKTQEQIAAELSGDLLSLGPDDPGARDFAKWLFDQIDAINSQLNGGAPQVDTASGPSQDNVVAMEQDTDMSMSTDSPEFNAPTGPKSMRNGPMRGGRERRMFGHMTKAMDRTHDSVLHRVRGSGNERINAHNRAPPTGPRGGGRPNNRMMNNRAAGISAGLNQMAANGMPGMPGAPGMNGMNGMNDMSWMMQGGAQQEQIFNLLQQQNQMMAQLQQQLAQQTQGHGGRPHGKSLFDRVQNPRGGNRRGGGHHGNGQRPQQTEASNGSEAGAEGEDVDMSQARREPPNPETTVCKYNLACTNKECKFAHQSPAAPPHTNVDVTDVCTFGVACKNRKCVGRHPSPATKRAHQNEQECKFYPNCTNPGCPFKHPDMPVCRNGGDCAVEGCKFTHLQTMCKYKPCTNRFCPYKHEEGQRGTYQDKVWTADGSNSHVSERRFVDQGAAEEVVIPGAEHEVLVTFLRSAYNNARHGHLQSTQPASKLPAMRRLSTMPASSMALLRLAGARAPGRGLTRVAIAQGRRHAYATVAPTGDKTDASDGPPREVAILGGGITGLTTAYYLARHAKNTHITIYEASDRLGGWIDSEPAPFDEGVLIHRGPRMLRSGGSSTKYDDLVLYDVIVGLDLQNQIRPPKPAAQERYIFYPDRLVRIPSPGMLANSIFKVIWSLMSDKLWDGCFKGMWNISLKNIFSRRSLLPPDAVRANLEQDESLAEFLPRIMGDERPVHNLVSAMVHGIYGGDVRKLSTKHTMYDSAWYKATAPPPSGHSWMALKDIYLLNDITTGENAAKLSGLAQGAVRWNTFMFDDGLLPLLSRLADDLEDRSNVTIRYSEPVTALRHENNKVLEPDRYDQVISTLFSKHLSQLAQPQNSLPSLAETHAVTMMVVNLWYTNSTLLDSNHGLGYLVPTTTPDNDECILGVLFDSDFQPRDEPPGTKLTVMLGGHYWDDWEHLPTEEMGIQMAIQGVKKHLGISDKEKVHASARLCRDCIPQHFVGHRERMKRAHYELLAAFKGQLMVAGPSYTSVGVVPAMRAGHDAAMRVAYGRGPPWVRGAFHHKPGVHGGKHPWEVLVESDGGKIVDHVGETGLQGFTEPLIDTLRLVPTELMLFRTWSSYPDLSAKKSGKDSQI
ncbi:hypothetical protein F5X96DRAFT_680192 [Biscogniauxia mediterranea]|nr:hypothetical protein F5X96DRAFT_680192 [Biscogniauxia mediterranea]